MNAASLLKFSRQAALAGESLWPGVVTIGDKDYEVMARIEDFQTELIEGGETAEGTLHVRLRKDLHPDKPADNLTLTYKGRKWKALEVGGDEDSSAVWLLECEPKN